VNCTKRGEFRIPEQDSVRTGRLTDVNDEVTQSRILEDHPSAEAGNALIDFDVPSQSSDRVIKHHRNGVERITRGLSPG